jgi:hypothetical protein
LYNPRSAITHFFPPEFGSSSIDRRDAQDQGSSKHSLPYFTPSFSNVAQVVFGGKVAYVPQTAWIRNATIRENIIFGQEQDNER